MKFALLFSQVLNGLATGMLYALMGIGLSIITGVLNIPNFAHGALFALGAYFLYTVIQLVGNFWLALLLAPLGVGLLGVLSSTVDPASRRSRLPASVDVWPLAHRD